MKPYDFSLDLPIASDSLEAALERELEPALLHVGGLPWSAIRIAGFVAVGIAILLALGV